MAKLRTTKEFIIQARATFKLAGGTLYSNTSFFSRTELRLLEREGLVERRTICGPRKYLNITPPMSYVYIWKNKEEMEVGNSPNQI